MSHKIRILFEGWLNLPHSYGIVLSFVIIHLYKNYKNKIEFFVKEEEYYNPAWYSKQKLVYTKEYNEILQNLKKYNGEDVDLIYRQTFPYNISVSPKNLKIPKLIFFTSEYKSLNTDYFKFRKPNVELNSYLKKYITHYSNIHFTCPSIWSDEGINQYLENKNRCRIITHGVDTTLFYKNSSKKDFIRKKYKIKESDFVLINVGAMTINKGILLILETMNILVNKIGRKDIKLILKCSADIYNCNAYFENYFMNLKKLNIFTEHDIKNLINNHIIFINDTLDFSEINDIFNECDLYIYPYIAEGFGLPILEALGSGLNILVPKTGCSKEYLEDIYKNGGNDFIYYVESEIVRDEKENGVKNFIKTQDILRVIFENETKIKTRKSDDAYLKLHNYLDKEYSWNKVANMTFEYINNILNFNL